MKRSFAIGNDIVDLGNARTVGKAADERFVGRVCSAGEWDTIRSSDDPDLELWCHWAAKETAFKVVSKLLGEPPPFVHRAFVIRWGDPASAPAAWGDDVLRHGHVRYERTTAEAATLLDATVWVKQDGDAVHAVGYGPSDTPDHAAVVTQRVELVDDPDAPWAGTFEELEGRFTERELDAVYSRESAAVRIGARADLAAFLATPEERLEIACWPGPTSQRPPYVLVDGKPAAVDVSLSHDGPLIAWAWWGE